MAFLTQLGQANVFPDGNVFHLRGDDPLLGVPKLGNRMTGGGAKRPSFQAGKFRKAIALVALGGMFGVCLGEVAVVDGLGLAPVVLLDIAPGSYPFVAQKGKAIVHVALESRISPRSTCVVNADGGVLLRVAVEGLGWVEGDLAHRHADVLVLFAFNIDTG